MLNEEEAQSLLWGLNNGELDTVSRYISNGLDPNTKIKKRTLLHHAADFGQVAVINYLLDCNADINATDEYGISVLLTAIYEDHYNCVDLLIRRGANIRALTPSGKSYLEEANNEKIKMLLQRACSG